jgi:hypothetical protein
MQAKAACATLSFEQELIRSTMTMTTSALERSMFWNPLLAAVAYFRDISVRRPVQARSFPPSYPVKLNVICMTAEKIPRPTIGRDLSSPANKAVGARAERLCSPCRALPPSN